MARQYKLLGTLDVIDNGVSSRLVQSVRGCALISHLIISGEPQSREYLADLLWESTSTEQALTRLRHLLSRLRPSVPELKVTRQAVSFQASGETSVDYYLLQDALAANDLTQLKSALAFHDGTLLKDFYVENAPGFNEWLALERERTRLKIWSGFSRLCAAYEEQEAWAAGVDAAQRWLALDDLDEQVLRQLMHFLAANGQAAAALKQYEAGRQRLWQELAVAPERATIELAGRIEAMQTRIEDGLVWELPVARAVGWPAAGALAEPGPLPRQSRLPYHRNATFTGRKAELLQLADRLLPPRDGPPGLPRTVVIAGMSGLGKSQLAVEYVYRYGRFYPGGVFWVNFADAAHVAEAVAAIGGPDGLGLFADSDNLPLDEKVTRIRQAWAKAKPRLLIFDNCEDELLAVAWLPLTGGCSILITSNEINWSKSLPLTVMRLDTLPRADSIKLLQHLSEAITETEADLVAAEMGDLPQALNLAGSFLGRYHDVPPEAYLRQLQEQQPLRHNSLQGKHIRYSPTGHELNVARTFAATVGRLDPKHPVDAAALQVLAGAACMAPNEPIPLRLFKAIVAQPAGNPGGDSRAMARAQEGANRLLSLGLLLLSGTEQVMMHQLVRLFVIDWLADDALAATERKVESAIIQALDEHRQSQGSLITLPFSVKHLRLVTDRALARQDNATAQLVGLMAGHLVEAADFPEAEKYLRAGLALAEAVFGNESLQMAEFAASMGNLLYTIGQYEAAEPYLAQALAIREQALGEDHIETSLSLNHMGRIRAKLGPYESAIPFFLRALAVRERLLGPDHPLTVGALNNLGATHNFMGEVDKARAYFEKVLEIRARTVGPDHLQTAPALNNLGDLLSRHGDPERGHLYLLRAVTIREQQLGSDHPLTLACKTNLGEALGKLGDFARAQAQLEQALNASLSKLGEYHPLTARIINTLGVLFTRMGRYEMAERHLEQALAIREQVRGRVHSDTAYTLICLGELFLATDDIRASRPLFERAIAILEATVEPTSPYLVRARAQLADLDGRLPETGPRA